MKYEDENVKYQSDPDTPNSHILLMVIGIMFLFAYITYAISETVKEEKKTKTGCVSACSNSLRAQVELDRQKAYEKCIDVCKTMKE